MSDRDDSPRSLVEGDQDEAITRLQAMQETIGTMGWRWYIQEVEQEIEVIKEHLAIADLDSVRFLQGRLDQLRQTQNFEALVDNYLDALTSEE